MNPATLLTITIAFLLIGALPRVFFRDEGRFNPRWWAVAWPFFACPAALLAFAFGWLPAPARLWHLFPGQDLLALLPALASIGLIGFTLGTHRIPIALWHQQNDAPREVVTWGAYRRIRHPFYASFLLGFLSACLLYPHPVLLLMTAYAFVVLNVTAAGEEQRLSTSAFGAEYRAYMETTGRFFPRLGA